MTKHLLEAAKLVSESAAADGTWKVRLISEGRGSSGVYTAEVLEKYHHAFSNVLSFKNHPTGWDGPQDRDFTMIAGEVVGETWVEKDERGLTSIVGNWRPDPEYAEKVARYRDKLGLSIYIEGDGHVDESTGDFIVDWFNEHDPYRSVDLVIAPGARGKFLESMRDVYSARRAEDEKPGSAPLQENGKITMDEELKKALTGIQEALAVLVAEKKAAEQSAAQVEADEKAVVSAVEAYDAAINLIDEADLLPPQVESLRAEAKAGRDVAPLIEAAKKVKEAAIEAARGAETGVAGVRLGENATTKFGAWK